MVSAVEYTNNLAAPQEKTNNQINSVKKPKNSGKESPKVSKIIKKIRRSNNSINIATLNVRTLKHSENTSELEEAFSESNIAISGLAEVRRNGEKIIITKNGNLLYHIGDNSGQKGVGFIVKKEPKDKILEVRGISNRIALIKTEIGKTRTTYVQVYAPASKSSEDEIEEFYEKGRKKQKTTN